MEKALFSVIDLSFQGPASAGTFLNPVGNGAQGEPSSDLESVKGLFF
jgi:hypothetical protein